MKRAKDKKRFTIWHAILENIYTNKKEYFIAFLILSLGIILGVLFINSTKDGQKQEISTYINNWISDIKNSDQIDRNALLKASISQELKLTFFMWFMGCTIIGIPIVYIVVLYRGFCLGYTISAIMATIGTLKGSIFTLLLLVLKNLFILPCILALAVSGLKLYRSIMKDKKKENIKAQLLRHTLFSLCIAAVLTFASLVDTYISSSLFMTVVNSI